MFGLVAVAAGLSGRFVLPWTHNPIYLVVAGGALAAFGVVQLVRGR